MTYTEWKGLVLLAVQSLIGLSFAAACVYMGIIGTLPLEFFCTIVGVVLGYFFAERKNGNERAHIERMAKGG